jgi:hypothetical protein
MRVLVATILLAAACGSKSPAAQSPGEAEANPADSTSEPGDTGSEGQPEGPFWPSECDESCAGGCPEVENFDLCMADCGCTPEGEDIGEGGHPCAGDDDE